MADGKGKEKATLANAAAIAYPEDTEKQQTFLDKCAEEEVTIEDLLACEKMKELRNLKLGLKAGPCSRLHKWIEQGM